MDADGRAGSSLRPHLTGTEVLTAGLSVGAGRYTLIRMLGQGGMGVVWLARDERLREQVALKFLPPEIRSDPVALDDLRRETARSHKLTHPNIVRIHDLHEVEGKEAFISMEYVDGPNLGLLRVRQASRVLSWELLRPLLYQLGEALEYAHAEHVIHRDLKPGNILLLQPTTLKATPKVKLADFGIAATVSDTMSRVSARRPSGTLVYMSPQQLEGRRPTVADDIYALGATLYELLTSKPPFYSGEIAHQVLYVAAEPLEERLAGLGLDNPIPTDVAALVMACLAKDPAQRPPSAQSMIDWMRLGAPPAGASRSAPVLAADRVEAKPGQAPEPPAASAPEPASFWRYIKPILFVTDSFTAILWGGTVMVALLLLLLGGCQAISRGWKRSEVATPQPALVCETREPWPAQRNHGDLPYPLRSEGAVRPGGLWAGAVLPAALRRIKLLPIWCDKNIHPRE